MRYFSVEKYLSRTDRWQRCLTVQFVLRGGQRKGFSRNGRRKNSKYKSQTEDLSYFQLTVRGGTF